ncbi:hypothetical protein BT246_63380 (plasmid) [Bacillus thuringiensis]|uniref:Integrase catalytic domain-containing protein n=1 Tax=Bacillus thuringiensis TaxID=1428 RepID=A0A9W3X3Y1_BACTU|nr:hypothetical protein BT246_63380 [Bacillus thuringiensis]
MIGGEVKLLIQDKYRKYSLALFTLPYSNQRFGYLYESETMICVQDVHVKCIEYLQFVPAVFTYDNMRTVVKTFIGTEREITDGMKNLSLHYQFKIRLCEPRKGNQKGHVERSVEYVRRKAFSHCDTFSSLEKAQQHLAKTLQKLNSRNHYLKHSPHHEFRVDKYSTITYRQNHYSVPEGHVGEYVKIKASAEQILIFTNGECIAKHKRCWQSHQWIMDIYHYLQTFEKKKGALAQSECLQQASTEIKKIYKNHYIGHERDFLALLFYVKENENLDKVLKAVNQLKDNQLVQLTTEKIIFLAEQDSVTVKPVRKSDEVASQSIENLSVITALFNSKKVEVLH